MIKIYYKKMSHNLRFLLIFLFIIVLNNYNFIFASNKIPQVGDKAPNILLYDLNNKLFNLRKIKYNDFILISFSATYCKPCKEEIKEFAKLQKKAGKDKLKIYLIFVDLKMANIKSYIKENKVKLPVLHDKYKIVSQKYAVKGLPNSFLIDKKGIIIYKANGYNK